MKSQSAAFSATAKVCVNGIIVGAEFTLTNTEYQVRSRDVSNIINGDLIQIYGKRDAPTSECYIQNMRIQFMEYENNDP